MNTFKLEITSINNQIVKSILFRLMKKTQKEVAVATIDLDDIRTYRNLVRSRNTTSANSPSYHRVPVDLSLSESSCFAMRASSIPFAWKYHSPEEEIALGPAGWLWDYLRFTCASFALNYR